MEKNQCTNKPIVSLTVAITTSSGYNKVNALVLSSSTIGKKMTFAENYREFIQLTKNHDPIVQTYCIFRHHIIYLNSLQLIYEQKHGSQD